MKCVQNPKNGETRRVSEMQASDLVAKGWKYISKDEWKRSTDTTWTKASVPVNPISPAKARRKEMRNG